MGMDLIGKKPASEKGEYFQNNVWWWRPLWEFTCTVCDDVLTEEDQEGGHTNDGYLITAPKARAIAAKLHELLESGAVASYAKSRAGKQAAMPEVTCEFCQGKGVRPDTKKKCNVCGGKGKIRPTSTWYEFSEQNVRKFADFCAASGGFEIC